MQKGFALIPLVLFSAVLVLAGISGWYYFNTQTPQELKTPQEAPETPPKELQIYKNSDLGFQLKLPEGLSIREETEAEFHKRSNGNMRQNFAYYVKYPPAAFITSLYLLDQTQDFKNAPLSIWVFDNPDNLSPEDFYKNYWYYPFVWGDYTQSSKNKIAPHDKFMVGNLEATGAAVVDIEPKFNYIYLKRDGKMYLLRTTPSADILENINFN